MILLEEAGFYRMFTMNKYMDTITMVALVSSSHASTQYTVHNVVYH